MLTKAINMLSKLNKRHDEKWKFQFISYLQHDENDDYVTDNSPIVDKYLIKYEEKFTH